MLYDDTQYFIGVFVACMRYKYVVRSYYALRRYDRLYARTIEYAYIILVW